MQAKIKNQGTLPEIRQRLNYHRYERKTVCAVAGSRIAAQRVEAVLEIPAVYIGKFIKEVKAGIRSLDASHVVFVDEAGKIHPDIYNEFLSVMEERGAIAVVHRTIRVVHH